MKPPETGTTSGEAMLPIGAVVEQLRRDFPDVSHSSLRFLEREGLLSAARTEGGHRLYRQPDIERVRRIKQWQAQRLSLAEIRQRLTHGDLLPVGEVLAQRFLDQATAGQTGAALATILEADEAGLPLAMLMAEVLQPALRELGRRWKSGELQVSQEKEVSELTRDVIAELVIRHGRTPVSGPALVAACPEGERHELGLRMLCGLLRADGRLVYYLGADVAPRFILEATNRHRPAAVLLSAMREEALGAIRATIDLMTPAPDSGPMIIVGGQATAGLAAQLRAWGALPILEDAPGAARDRLTQLLEERLQV